MTDVAIRRRPRHERDAKPQAPRARGLQPKCGALVNSGEDNGIRIEQHCEARLHGDDERHLPGSWIDIGPIDDIF